MQMDGIGDDIRTRLEKPAGLWIEKVSIAADFVDGPWRVDPISPAVIRSPDHVVKHVPPTYRGPTASILRDVIHLFDLERRHVTVFHEARRDALDLTPPVGGVRLDQDLLRHNNQIRLPDRPGVEGLEPPRR